VNRDGWQSTTLRDIATFASGKTPLRSRQADYFDKGTVPWVKTMDLTNASIVKTEERVTRRAIRDVKLQVQPEGTVLVAMYGGFNQIGRTGVLRVPAATNQAITAVLPDARFVNSAYLLHLLNYKVGYWRTVASSSRKDPNITKSDIKDFPLSLPPLREQDAIASAINDSDDLISALSALIVKKQTVKQGMMQQLLTGHTRLPGFTEPWTQATWGELAETISSGSTPRRSNGAYWNGRIPWVTSTELNRGVIHDVPQRITESGLCSANLNVWPAGTFLIAITGLEAAGTRGSCGILGLDAATNQSCMAVIPKNRLDSLFLFYFYLLRGEELAFRFTQGTKQQSYTAAIVKTLPIWLPTSITEQRAISATLWDVEHQLEALGTRLAKAREVKQGMMQQLLTGRTRLPVQEATA
jgi:type I restriction enzyme, S subunit